MTSLLPLTAADESKCRARLLVLESSIHNIGESLRVQVEQLCVRNDPQKSADAQAHLQLLQHTVARAEAERESLLKRLQTSKMIETPTGTSSVLFGWVFGTER